MMRDVLNRLIWKKNIGKF